MARIPIWPKRIRTGSGHFLTEPRPAHSRRISGRSSVAFAVAALVVIGAGSAAADEPTPTPTDTASVPTATATESPEPEPSETSEPEPAESSGPAASAGPEPEATAAAAPTPSTVPTSVPPRPPRTRALRLPAVAHSDPSGGAGARLHDDVAYTTADQGVTVNVAANDTNVANAYFERATEPLHGLAGVEGGYGFAWYQPGPGFATADSDSFEYTAKLYADGGTVYLEPATVTVVRVEAVDDRVVTRYRRPVDVDVRANDHGAADLGVRLTSGPPAGTVEVTGSDAGFRVTPVGTFAGTVTFGYALLDPSDSERVLGTATVTVRVPPQASARPDEATTLPGEPVTVAILGNDVNPDHLHPVLRTPPARGEASLAGDDVVYRPATGLAGDDTFRYGLATPGGDVLSEAEVTIHVTPPAAEDDAAEAFAGRPVRVDVRANDTHAAGFTVRTDPADAGAVVQPDGAVVYTPPAGSSGRLGVRYELVDARGAAVDDATVWVSVTDVRAAADAARTSASRPVTIAVLANDSGTAAVRVELARGPRHGTATVETDGTVRYTPGAGFGSADDLRYALTGLVRGVRTELAAADVVVTRVDPVDDTAATTAGHDVRIAVRANDVNPAGLAPRIVDGPADGTATVAGGRVVYDPRSGFEGPDSFRYTLAGDGRTFGVATVRVTVRAEVDEPGEPGTTTSPEPNPEPNPAPTPEATPTPERTSAPAPAPGPARQPRAPKLALDVRSASPGAPVTAHGTGCTPGADVAIAVDGRAVTTVEASGAGTFRVELDAPGRIGRHDVSATCGRSTRHADVDVVVTTMQSATQAPVAAAAVAAGLLLFFLLSGLGLNPTGRRHPAIRR
jgi:hypothetical protein